MVRSGKIKVICQGLTKYSRSSSLSEMEVFDQQIVLNVSGDIKCSADTPKLSPSLDIANRA